MDKESSDKIGEAYEKLNVKLFLLALRRVRDGRAAEEIVNDTFVEVMKHRIWWCGQKYPIREKYITETCERLCAAYQKREAGHNCVPYDDDRGETYGSDRCIVRIELRESLCKCMELLGEEDRWILGAKYFANQSTEQIGEKLGINRANVLQRLVRARQKLRIILEKQGMGDFDG